MSQNGGTCHGNFPDGPGAEFRPAINTIRESERRKKDEARASGGTGKINVEFDESTANIAVNYNCKERTQVEICIGRSRSRWSRGWARCARKILPQIKRKNARGVNTAVNRRNGKRNGASLARRTAAQGDMQNVQELGVNTPPERISVNTSAKSTRTSRWMNARENWAARKARNTCEDGA
ncbi:hypothetical protein B0H10DRAFT_1963780 [Mycena sp. CBHHK59/15]|nr:hypothetical protein B0H10DRAFT_1963780 [Mycena sp. CBHHK59/15]